MNYRMLVIFLLFIGGIFAGDAEKNASCFTVKTPVQSRSKLRERILTEIEELEALVSDIMTTQASVLRYLDKSGIAGVHGLSSLDHTMVSMHCILQDLSCWMQTMQKYTRNQDVCQGAPKAPIIKENMPVSLITAAQVRTHIADVLHVLSLLLSSDRQFITAYLSNDKSSFILMASSPQLASFLEIIGQARGGLVDLNKAVKKAISI